MLRVISPTPLFVVLVFAPPLWSQAQYTIKQSDGAPPQELREPIRSILGKSCYQLLNDKGAAICELWFREQIPVKATPEQIKNGLTYREIEESTVLGAVRFVQPASDYRKQRIKAGVYTLRLGYQPMDGDHMGTAPYPDFCLLIPAKLDEKPNTIETKELRELSAQSIGSGHPGILLLFPNEQPEDMPKLVDKGDNTWVLNLKRTITIDNKAAQGSIGLSLTLIGRTTMQ